MTRRLSILNRPVFAPFKLGVAIVLIAGGVLWGASWSLDLSWGRSSISPSEALLRQEVKELEAAALLPTGLPEGLAPKAGAVTIGLIAPEVRDATQLARWHSSVGQGLVHGGRVREGREHLLRALNFALQALNEGPCRNRRSELVFLSGKALYLVFRRPAVLDSISQMGSRSVWAVRAMQVLRREPNT